MNFMLLLYVSVLLFQLHFVAICSIPQKMFTFFASPYTQLTWDIWFWSIQTLLSLGTKVKPQRIHWHEMWHAAERRIGLVHFCCFSVMWERLFPHSSLIGFGRCMWLVSLFPTEENIKSSKLLLANLATAWIQNRSVIISLVYANASHLAVSRVRSHLQQLCCWVGSSLAEPTWVFCQPSEPMNYQRGKSSALKRGVAFWKEKEGRSGEGLVFARCF